MTLTHSRFNHVVQDPASSTWVLYNFFTGRHIRLDAISYGLYLRAPENPRTPFAQSLEKHGFLARGNEMEALRHATNLARYGTKNLMLTICPTMGCNFACPYCFEEHRVGRMSEKTQDDLVSFIEKQLEGFRMRSMCVVWFGGEPLLQPGIIHALSQRIVNLANKYHVAYTANVVTNGYNLNAKNVALLKNSQVTGLQVTLDGPNAQTHDATRMTRGGKGSFDRIVSNLRALPEGFDVKIRCNVGPHNIGMLNDMRRLVDMLNATSASSFCLAPGIMDMDVAKANGAIDTETRSKADAETGAESAQTNAPKDSAPLPTAVLKSNSYEAVNKALSELGMFEYDTIGARMPGHFHGTFCGSQCAHTYVIDEDGDLYRCWEDCGDKAARFGNVADFDSRLFGATAAATAYLESAWCGDDPQCGSCPILPVCMGGCPHRHQASGKRRCPWFKSDLDAYVLNLVNRENTNRTTPGTTPQEQAWSS